MTQSNDMEVRRRPLGSTTTCGGERVRMITQVNEGSLIRLPHGWQMAMHSLQLWSRLNLTLVLMFRPALPVSFCLTSFEYSNDKFECLKGTPYFLHTWGCPILACGCMDVSGMNDRLIICSPESTQYTTMSLGEREGGILIKN